MQSRTGFPLVLPDYNRACSAAFDLLHGHAISSLFASTLLSHETPLLTLCCVGRQHDALHVSEVSMWALLQVVAIGSCHSNEGLKLEEVALRAEDAKLLLRGGLLGPHQNATLMLTDFLVAQLHALIRQATHNNKYNDNANNINI